MAICTKGTPIDGSRRYNSDGPLLDSPPRVCHRFAEPLFLAEGFKRHHWASLPAVRCHRFSDYQSCCDHIPTSLSSAVSPRSLENSCNRRQLHQNTLS